MVVMVDLERKFFTTRVVHMNNLGKEKIALKQPMQLLIFLKQEEIISLYSKNECEVSVIVLMKITSSYRKVLRQLHWKQPT